MNLISQRLDNYYQIQTNATVVTVATVTLTTPIPRRTKRGLGPPSPNTFLSKRMLLLVRSHILLSLGWINNQEKGKGVESEGKRLGMGNMHAYLTNYQSVRLAVVYRKRS